MYDADYFFVENPLGRYSLSARDQLKSNPDGSLDIYIQRHPPGCGPGIQLAARRGRQVHPHAAVLLAQAIPPRRLLEDPAREADGLNERRLLFVA